MIDFATVSQPPQLLIKHLLDRPLAWGPLRTICYRDVMQMTYRGFYERVQKLAQVLTRLGVQHGDRVGVMDLDSHRYLELFFAVPMVGAVLHTINVRLSSEQVHYTIEHANDCVLFIHTDFLALATPLLPRLPGVQSVVLMSEEGPAPDAPFTSEGEYELLLAAAPASFEFPDFDENTIATLFYTTGTTGDPKGVFFSHRQLVLHTLSVGLMFSATQQPFGISTEDVYMPLTPMFHAHAWGFPYVATLLGLKQVYPGRYEPERLLRLIGHHDVTITHCVPTIVQLLLHHPASRQTDLSKWKLIIGGSALSEGLAREAMERGIRIMGAYGLSETCPVLTAAQFQPSMAGADAAAQLSVITRAGLPAPLVRVRIVDTAGQTLSSNKENTGELVVQAPWLTAGYFKNEASSRDLWSGGWLHTGDVAYLDDEGYVRITDRLKDVIKIGGEWISSLELENALSQHEAVKEAAVVARPDARWGERPYAEVVVRREQRDIVTVRTLTDFLHHFIDKGLLHKRAVLTQIQLVEALPRTSVGKLDKKAIRRRLAKS